MEPQPTGSNQPPVVVITGETGSGKSALAVDLAKLFDGEIIAADSRTVYRGMDIGTAKPTPAERQGITHYGLDIVNPGQSFTVFDFQQLAYQAVGDINNRGKLPIIVGGTGLYIDSFLYGFRFRAKPADGIRSALGELSVAELQKRIMDMGLALPNNAQNTRHLVRLIESGEAPKQARNLRPNTLVVGLKVPPEALRERITQRVGDMFAAGLVEEVRTLLNTYPNVEALRAPGYKAVVAYIGGELGLAEAKQQFIRDDMRLAKRQRTWFRRNTDIQWVTGENLPEQAIRLVRSFLHR